MFIYGSYANNTAGLHSDIDVFIIGTIDQNQLILAIKKLEKKLSREINYVAYEPKEFKERVKKKDSFVTNVIHEPKILLIGDLHEFI